MKTLNHLDEMNSLFHFGQAKRMAPTCKRSMSFKYTKPHNLKDILKGHCLGAKP